MFHNMIHPRHNGSVPPNSFTSVQGMRVRNHCLLLLYEVMGLLMLMTLGSSLRSHPAPIATPIPILSHAVTTTRTTSLQKGSRHLLLHRRDTSSRCSSPHSRHDSLYVLKCNFVVTTSLKASDTRFNHCTFCLLQKLTHIPISQCESYHDTITNHRLCVIA